MNVLSINYVYLFINSINNNIKNKFIYLNKLSNLISYNNFKYTEFYYFWLFMVFYFVLVKNNIYTD
jgi:hypothetical protein